MEENDPLVKEMRIRQKSGGIRGGSDSVEIGWRGRFLGRREKVEGAGVEELPGESQSTPRPFQKVLGHLDRKFRGDPRKFRPRGAEVPAHRQQKFQENRHTQNWT